MADRVERLTNLLALLLETPEPLSLVQIAGELSGQYPESKTARRAAFERDKAVLRDIGVPIEQEIIGGADAGQTRYWIDRERYEMGGLDLDDDEMRALQVAMAATRPGSSSGQDALWKLGGGVVDQRSTVTAVVPDVAELPTLREAVADRRVVTFRYNDVDRVVDPWGLLLRNGYWYMIGFDHGRGERRTYRIDRIAGHVDIDRDRDPFERPADFDPREAFPDDPKLIGADANLPDARVWIDATRAAAAARELGEDRVVRRLDDGAIEVMVPCANAPAFRSWLLGHLEHAEVLEPPALRAEVVAFLEAALA
ncbi:helix-turn-helix transcriptional regulator [Ilumatobacter sp.]|uniref:helix-turn-helix transcriptional regulator n=1 Tax=Ilumatobacter sp. TaxID=1967498 RepID=UPI003AF5932A